jgi:hypothetical protein
VLDRAQPTDMTVDRDVIGVGEHQPCASAQTSL